MKRVFLLILISGIISVSCKKDESEDNQTPTPTPSADYMQLEVGNYWVYQWYNIDSSGNESLMAKSDSSIITGDTLIGGRTYFKKLIVQNENYVEFLRDSIGYLVDHGGMVRFSDHDFTKILRIEEIVPDVATIEFQMANQDSLISISLGTYPTYNFRGTVYPMNPQYPYGINYTHNFYADGMGLIKTSSYYFSNPNLRVERRLVSFGNNQ
jgi:hypothetical protein